MEELIARIRARLNSGNQYTVILMQIEKIINEAENNKDGFEIVDCGKDGIHKLCKHCNKVVT